jgi:hypothetical protein
MFVACTLVGIDLREHFTLDLVLEIGNHSFTQIIDYCRVHFIYAQCHEYGHKIKR